MDSSTLSSLDTIRLVGSDLHIGNADIEITISIAETIQPDRLVGKRRGTVYADGGYRYSFAVLEPERTTLWKTLPRYRSHQTEEIPAGGTILTVCGAFALGPQELAIEHQFTIPADRPYIEERIILTNRSDRPFTFAAIGCGFLKYLRMPNGEQPVEVKDRRAVAVPYRREPMGQHGEYCDFSMEDLSSRKGWYRLEGFRKGRFYTSEFGAEGWVLTDGKAGLLVNKYSQELMEFSLLAIEPPEAKVGECPWESDRGTLLRFGGCGLYHADPEAGARLETGERVAFGLTRYTSFDGGWKRGYTLFRDFMDEHGHLVPPDYNPPVHWNELYDNPLWWGGSSQEQERRGRYYRLPDMEIEAAKAHEVGCEALYLDPGWDELTAPSVWADERLGTLPEFIQLMQEKYNLAVSLHTPLTGWADPSTYPRVCDRMDQEGKILPNNLCSGSQTFLQIKTERLLKLAAQGIVYFMFDGNGYTGPCYHPGHGHPIPYTREAHCRVCLRLAQALHERFPRLIIEMHDMIVAGQPTRYCPTYYLHGLPGSFDENWAFEYMWDPLDDLLSGRALSLYYYNLAYSLPLYLHIPALTDNQNCLHFWWYASTIRHLGIGGVGDDQVKLAALKRAMQHYMALKRYFVQGTFCGIDESTHIHTLPGEGAVGLWFNLDDGFLEKSLTIDLREIGIEPETFSGIEEPGTEKNGELLPGLVHILQGLIGSEPATYKRMGGIEAERKGEQLAMTVRIPSRSVVLGKFTSRPPAEVVADPVCTGG